MKQILYKLFEHQYLGRDEARTILQNIAQGKYNDVQVASLITVFLMRNISVEELCGFRDALLEMRIPVDLSEFAPIDIVGTGGDGKNTFNISTASCFTVAGAGFPVVKHGNYGATSVSGASNVMEQHGVKFTSDVDQLRRSMEKCNLAYLHAPLFNPALKAVAPVRKGLAVRTFFNMLGPLVNPVLPAYQLLGVYNLPLLRLYTYTYQESKTKFAVVHSLDGYDEISLSSLSISDYSKISELTDNLLSWTNEKMINLSLPSMRADSFTKELMDKIATVRQTTLTFAPEAGSPRLRDVINKNITEEEILRACSVAYSAGKNQIKLYFMDGLPYETYEDIEGISTLASHVVDEYYRTPDRHKGRQPQVTLSVACFIPKPFTPFQWEGQNTLEELRDKQDFLSSKIKDRKVRYNYHDAKVSRLEAVFARGDRRLSKALEEAIRRHVRFDSWEEQFDYDNWMDIFAAVGVDPSFYANRSIPDDEILPWDMLSCGVSKEFLLSERHKAQKAVATPSCKEKCSGCGVNKLVDKKYCRWCPGHPESSDSAGRITSDKVFPTREETMKNTVKPARLIRIRFRKFGAMLYISHLDLAKTLMKSVVRSGLPVYYTEGYNPKPKLVFATPLSVGCGGEEEVLDIRLMNPVGNEEITEKLRAVMPNGIEITRVYEQKGKLNDIKWAECEIKFGKVGGMIELDENALSEITKMFDTPYTIMKRSKSGERECDISPLVKKISAVCEGGELTVTAVTSADAENYLNPEYVAKAVEEKYNLGGENGWHVITRKKLLLSDGESEFI